MNDDFYRECARLLGCPYDCKPFPYERRTRWNNRSPGQGRYAGHGTIRVFGDSVHVALYDPVLNLVAKKEEVLALLKNQRILEQ